MPKTPEEQLGVSLPPEAEQQTTPPELPVEEDAADEQRPEWLLPKFESVEEQARSYAEAQQAVTRAQQERSDLEQRLAALEAEREQFQQYDPNQQWYDPASEQEQLAQLYEEDPVAATQAILRNELQAMQQAQMQQYQQAQQMQQPLIEAQRATQAEVIASTVDQRMHDRYDDWGTYQQQAQEILQNRQIPPEQLFSIPAFERHVDEAYRLAKFDALAEREQVMREAGIDQGEIDRQLKLQAQTMSGRSAREAEVTPDERKAADLLAAHRGAQHYGSWAAQNIDR